jgi:hypothetical protein
MRATTALSAGLGAAARNARLLWWLLFSNLLLAALAVWPLLRPFEATLEWHPAPEQMARRFDMAWWVDVTTAHAVSFARTIEMAGALSFLAALLGCFFAGGMLQAYADTFEGRRMDRFMTSCRRWAPRFILLFALSLPLYWLVHRLVNTRLELALRDLLEQVADERVGLLLRSLKIALFLILFDAVTLFADYARVHAIVTPDRSMPASLRAGILFVLRHPLRVGGLEAMGILLQIAALMLYLPVDGLLTRASPAGLAAGLAAGQIFILTRLFLREASRAGQVALYRATLAARSARSGA